MYTCCAFALAFFFLAFGYNLLPTIFQIQSPRVGTEMLALDFPFDYLIK
jgi:hypothetical protein